jgi:hypothetical protein
MAGLDTWVAEYELPDEPFVRMKQAVVALFANMERNGELDQARRIRVRDHPFDTEAPKPLQSRRPV